MKAPLLMRLTTWIQKIDCQCDKGAHICIAHSIVFCFANLTRSFCWLDVSSSLLCLLYIYISSHTPTCIHAYVDKYTYAYVLTHKYINIYIYMRTCFEYENILYICIYINVCPRSCTCANLSAYTCVYMYICIYIYVYI